MRGSSALNGAMPNIRITQAATIPAQMNGTEATYRNPSANSWLIPRGASDSVTRGRASASAVAETRNDATSIAQTADGPAVAKTTAAIAGPAMLLDCRAIPSHELADGSIGGSTTSGTIPLKAGAKKPSAKPKHAASASTIARSRWP